MTSTLFTLAPAHAALAAPRGDDKDKKAATTTTTTTAPPTTTTAPPTTTSTTLLIPTCAPAPAAAVQAPKVVLIAPKDLSDEEGQVLHAASQGQEPEVEVIEPETTVDPDRLEAKEASVDGDGEKTEAVTPEQAQEEQETVVAAARAGWREPGTVVVAIGPEIAAVIEPLPDKGPYLPISSVYEGALSAGTVNGARDASGQARPAVTALSVTHQGDGSWTIDSPQRIHGDTLPVTGLYVETAQGRSLACEQATTLPAQVTSSDGTSAGIDVVAATAIVQQPPPDGSQNGPVEAISWEQPPPPPAPTPAPTVTPASSGKGTSPITLVLGLVVLGLLGVIAYLVNRKPRVPEGAMAFAGAPTGTMAPGVLGGSMAPGGGAPALPVRYTEPAPVAHRRAPDPAPGWTGTIPGGAEVRLEDLGLLRVVPKATGPGRKTWSHETNRWMLTGGWVEKVAGKGEDAEPAMRINRSGAGLIGVFDGTGGAGSASARRLSDGTDLSGAYVASRLSKEVAEAWATEQIDRNEGPVADELRDRLARSLQDEALYPDVPKSTMRGSLQRVLPTTMAAIRFASGPDGVDVDALWAGDSRAFVLSPQGGLQVLTVDDTRETDALELIRNDQPMSNLVSADRPFTVNHRRYRINRPAVLLTATDGCFGYVRTPAHFEFLLLDSLDRMTSLDTWAAELVDSLAAIAGDDSSFAIGAFGFESYEEMQEQFRPRRSFLAERHWTPFQRAADPAEIEALRVSSWESYRDLYHARIQEEPPR